MSHWSEEPLVFGCGGDRLVGILHRANNPDPKVGVLVVVGGPQYRVGSHRQFVLMARDLAEAGYPVLRFDYRGMGDSEGTARSFESIQHDISAAIEAFFRSTAGPERLVLWGLCDGASAVAMSAAADPRIAGIALVNPWVRTSAGEASAYLEHYYGRRLLQRAFWAKIVSGEFDVIRAVRDFVRTVRDSHKKELADGWQVHTTFVRHMRDGLQSFAGPVFVLLSGSDLVAMEFRAARAEDEEWKSVSGRPNISIVELPSADHTFSSRPSLEAASAALIGWLSRVRAHR